MIVYEELIGLFICIIISKKGTLTMNLLQGYGGGGGGIVIRLNKGKY
jgi:hypothetical protein